MGMCLAYLGRVMKIILDVPDLKAEMMLELLSHFPFVKVARMSKEKARSVEDLFEAMSEIGEIRSGRRKRKTLDQLLEEL